MQIAAYVRVSTDDQNEERQMRAKYADPEQENEIDWYCALGKSRTSPSRQSTSASASTSRSTTW